MLYMVSVGYMASKPILTVSDIFMNSFNTVPYDIIGRRFQYMHVVLRKHFFKKIKKNLEEMFAVLLVVINTCL